MKQENTEEWHFFGGGSAASRAASGVFLRGRLCSHVPSGQAASGQGLPGWQRSGPPSLGDGLRIVGQS